MWGFLLAYISPNFRRFTHFRKSISYNVIMSIGDQPGDFREYGGTSILVKF